jgi:hypothetical protein
MDWDGNDNLAGLTGPPPWRHTSFYSLPLGSTVLKPDFHLEHEQLFFEMISGLTLASLLSNMT